MRTLLALLILSVFLFTSCGQAETSNSTANKPSAPEFARAADDGSGGGRKSESPNGPAPQTISLEKQSQAAVPERKIIRNAELTLESDDLEQVQKMISSIAEAKGGFVAEVQQSIANRRATGRDTVTIALRVPADRFAETLDEIRQTAGRVIFENVKGQDVTEEFIDIEARLKAHRALEEQFLEIMKRANTVADALNVQRELANVRGEIEKVEGRKKFLENQASLSTIRLKIQTSAAISASGSGFFYRLTDAVSTGFDAALGFILGLVTVLIAVIPFLLFICLPLFLVLRYLWKRIRRRRTAAEIAVDELTIEND